MLIDVWYDQHRRLLLSSDAALDDLFGCEPQRQVRDDHYSHLAGSTATAVHGEGGSSSGWATTFLAGGIEWSATGLQGASLAAPRRRTCTTWGVAEPRRASPRCS